MFIVCDESFSPAPSGAAYACGQMPLLTELGNNATPIYKHCAPPERGELRLV